MNKTLSQHMDEFAKYLLEERNSNELTVRNYKSYLSRLLAFAISKTTQDNAAASELIEGMDYGCKPYNDNPDLSILTIDLIRDFKTSLIASGLSHKTANYYLIGIRMFLKYLVAMDQISVLPEKIELFRNVKTKEMELISHEELRTFLTTRVEPMSDLLANVLFSTGLRIFELAKLNIEDIRGNKFTVRGKGSKDRIIFLAPGVGDMLTNYVGGRKTGPIFINRAGRAMTVRYLQRIITVRADKLSMSKKVSCHTMRHLFATDLLENGADLRSVQEMLGHASVTTTQRYTHISNKHLENSFTKFHTEFKIK